MIRKAVREDFDFFFSIKSEEDNLYWCGYREKPIRANLLAFWNKYVPDGTEREIYIVQEKNYPVGYLYIDYSTDTEAELSIGISITQSGKGYGTRAVKEALTLLHAAKLSAIAYIREDNNKSQALFEKAGLARTNKYREMMLPGKEDHKLVKLYQWKSEYRSEKDYVQIRVNAST